MIKTNNIVSLIDKLANVRSLSVNEYEQLTESFNNAKIVKYIKQKSQIAREKVYKKDVYIRGLIEISNICKNNCYYCGIRKDNNCCERYSMTDDDILSFCQLGYSKGIKTFVLQAGESGLWTDEVLVKLIKEIKKSFAGCVVTLSLGERSCQSYEKLHTAGANRYLLRHETYNKGHYRKLHPDDMSFENRIECLYSLKKIGFQTGCGFMVGSPYQTFKNIANDLKFIEKFQPEMVGIGPFIPQKETPFLGFKAGSVDLTLFLVALIRLISPNALIPATTALASLDEDGLKKGLQFGANVVMLNLASDNYKKKYKIYANKACLNIGFEKAFADTKKLIEKLGLNMSLQKGDYIM